MLNIFKSKPVADETDFLDNYLENERKLTESIRDNIAVMDEIIELAVLHKIIGCETTHRHGD